MNKLIQRIFGVKNAGKDSKTKMYRLLRMNKQLTFRPNK